LGGNSRQVDGFLEIVGFPTIVGRMEALFTLSLEKNIHSIFRKKKVHISIEKIFPKI